MFEWVHNRPLHSNATVYGSFQENYHLLLPYVKNSKRESRAQLTFTCSKSTIEPLEKVIFRKMGPMTLITRNSSLYLMELFLQK